MRYEFSCKKLPPAHYIQNAHFALLALIVFISANVRGQGIHDQNAAHTPSETAALASNESSLRPVLEVLNKGKLSGSLEISGTCKSLTYPYYPEILSLRVAPPDVESPLQTVRMMFAGDPKMRVTQNTSRIIRMVQKSTPTDILDVTIAHVSFDVRKGGVDNANAALEIIKGTPELQNFLKVHDSRWLFNGGAISILTDANSKPTPVPSWVSHISGSMNYVTVREALDRILRAFPGLWIYENCPSRGTTKRIIYLRFYHLQNTVTGTIIE